MKNLRISHSVPVVALAFATCTAWGAAIQAPGLPHLQQVTEKIYRGAQPTSEGWQSLAKMGVKVVVNLRREGEDGQHSAAAEAKLVEAAGMRYVHVPMKGLVAPTDAQVSKVLALLVSGEPVFVHCKKGMDRTGTVIASYRIAYEGWDNKKALAEAKSLGMHWVEIGMRNFIASYRGAPVAAPAAAVVTADATPAVPTAEPAIGPSVAVTPVASPVAVGASAGTSGSVH